MTEQLSLFDDGTDSLPAAPTAGLIEPNSRDAQMLPDPAAIDLEIVAARQKSKARKESRAKAPPPPSEADELESFPTTLLPAVIRDIVQETSLGHLIPESLPAACALASISEVLGAGLEVQSDSAGNSKLAGNLFIMAVAESGTGKGRAYSEIVLPLDELGAEERDRWQANVYPGLASDIEEQQAIMVRIRKDLAKTKDASDRITMKEEMTAAKCAIATLEQELGRAPVWNAGEATREALARLAAGQVGEAISSRSGEARGILSVLAGRYAKGNESDEDIFLHLYSRDPKTINRQGSPPIILKRPTGSVLWLIQPDKARELLGMANMTESGLLPRFIAFDSGAQAEDIPEARHQISEASRLAWADLLRCLARSFRANGGNPGLVVPSPEAFSVFRAFDNETRAARREGGKFKDIASFAARWAENAWRIALVLHAVLHRDKAPNQPLSRGTAENAISLQKWFMDGQLRLLATGRNARRTARFTTLRELLANGPISLRDLSNSHGFSKEEVQGFADRGLIEIETVKTPGRSSQIAKLKTISPS